MNIDISEDYYLDLLIMHCLSFYKPKIHNSITVAASKLLYFEWPKEVNYSEENVLKFLNALSTSKFKVNELKLVIKSMKKVDANMYKKLLTEVKSKKSDRKFFIQSQVATILTAIDTDSK